MPTKSNNMSPMPMQPKIGEASLKFGPDWLRALSSSENTGNNANNTSPGGDTGGGRPGFGFSGWGVGTSDGRVGFSSNNKEYSASSHFTSPPSYHQQHHQSVREGKGGTPPNSTANSRFKPSENRYSREEMLALYDKNLDAPTFLLTLGTLYIEKMQPPMAFSQPLEEEIRIWHSPQPESSRQGTGTAPVGRGFAIRGRGGVVERGRGRGRGGYYGRPLEEEERGSFSRPRNFDRSQSVHERPPWGERNGSGGPSPAGPEENNRGGGGSWRNRESFGGRRHEEGNDDGWRKPRWRRGDEDQEEGGHRNNSASRRLNRSWSEDENHDNIPEWARDNPSEESGTFDSSGAFHGEDRSSSKSREFDRKPDNDMKSRVESEPSGSHNDRVQKRVPDRVDSVKPVIPAPVKEEGDSHLDDNDYTPAKTNRAKERSDQFSSSSQQQHGVKSIINNKNEVNEIKHDDSSERLVRQQQHGQIGVGESQQLIQKQLITTVQHQVTASHESRTQMTHSQSVNDRNNPSVVQQQQRLEMRASNSSHDSGSVTTIHNRHSEEDHYRSMTEEAMNLVSKLIEDDGSGSRASPASGHGSRMPIPQQQQQLLSGVNTNSTNSITNSNVAMNVNDISQRNSGIASNNVPIQQQQQNIPQTVHSPAVSPSSLDVWFYRDPQGSVQGPFNTHEMALWCSQGYFTGTLFLRRECDKMFITLAEMGKLYGRNPFAVNPDSPPPPPIQDPSASALDFPRGDGNQIQAQLQQQQRQQQLLQQQNMLREQQVQYMMNMNHGNIRKEEPGWQGPSQVPQQSRPAPNAPSLASDQIQAQLLLSMAKSQGLERDSSAMDKFQALFHRQLKNSSGDALSSHQNQKNDFGDMIPNRHNPQIDPSKSPVPATDPIQSLVQQLTSMANTQQHKVAVSNKPDVISPWGAPPSMNVVQPPVPNQWGSHSNPAPWEYRDQIALTQKLHQDEELRRRKEEEEAERKRLEEDERKRVEEQQRLERKRLEEQQRLEEEKQRKIREEQYLLQKQQQELALQKQQEEAEMNRQKELLLQRQMEQRQLEQQRQMRDEQTRLAEEQQQRLEQQRLEKERKEKEQAERELKMRQERERQEQIKMQQQQFSWNPAAPPQAPPTGSKTLLEIQQEESIKQEKEASIKKKQQQEQLRIQQQQAAQQQKAINLKWAQGAAPQKTTPIKSLTEIQAEEQAKLQKAQEKEREKRQIIQQHQQQQQAWSAQLTWANRASTIAAAAASGGGSKKVNGGVWDDSSMATKIKSSSSNNQSSATSNKQQSSGKRTKELSEDSFMKLFAVQEPEVGGGGSPQQQSKGGNRQKPQQSIPSVGSGDDFTRWCFDRVQAIGGGSVDIPTFVGFLKEVESPYEVNDYVRSYLGDGKDARDFSREFLERRSRWKNARKDGGGSFEDNLCRPASAVNPNSNDFQEVKAKGKKTKKGKMQKVDSRILGFSTSAATDRLNVGNRDYGDNAE